MSTPYERNKLQKFSAVCSTLCFICSGLCVLIIAIFFSDFSKVYNASFASSGFFFFTAAIVLKEMADTNLPKPYSNKAVSPAEED